MMIVIEQINNYCASIKMTHAIQFLSFYGCLSGRGQIINRSLSAYSNLTCLPNLEVLALIFTKLKVFIRTELPIYRPF